MEQLILVQGLSIIAKSDTAFCGDGLHAMGIFGALNEVQTR